MDRTERFYKIEMLIRSRGEVSFAQLLQELEVSPATLKRDLAYLRDRLNAPIQYERFSNAYRFASDWRGAPHELPGVWFSERELHALLTMHQLLAGLDDDGILTRHLQPVFERLTRMLGADESEAKALMQRVKLIGTARRRVPSQHFEVVGSAVVRRQRLYLRYRSRARGQVSEREVSPQRLVHYRHTWYLDAWCHQSDALRRFALDAIEQATPLADKAKSVPVAKLQAELDQGYGIFGGAQVETAVLEFDAEAAAWVSAEEWHPDQQAQWLPGGRWQLKVPYVDATELLMDVLRHAGHVQVQAPPALKQAFAQRLQAAVAGLDSSSAA